jgi:hypothetical protein
LTRLRWRLAAIVLSVAAAVAVVSTYSVFSQTLDEPAHIASGMEWLTRGTYTYDGAQHPPLTHILAALGPRSRGAKTRGMTNQFVEGDVLLDRGAEYRTRLALARLGELPFLILLCAATWLWGRRLLGEAGGALAVLFVVTNPNILAHAGLATTDIGITAAMPAALYAYARWTDERTRKRALWFGFWMAVAALTKFTALPFIGITILLAELWRSYIVRARRDAWGFPPSQLGMAILLGLAVVWAGYRFSVGPLRPGGVPVPAPELWHGLGTFLGHASLGHESFLLGETNTTGWWYYFPIAFLVKTPLPLLALGIVGIAGTMAAIRRKEFDAVLPITVLIAVMSVGLVTKVDIGIRHILPLYPFLALLAARGTIELWTRVEATELARAATVALAGSTLFVAARAHPDHLAYFNPIAGAHPERILVDSNLDWGQDLYRLADVMQRMRIGEIRVAYFGSADLQAAGVPNARRLEPNERATGWIAASQTSLAGLWVGQGYQWLYDYELVGRIGPSLLLFHVPAAAAVDTTMPIVPAGAAQKQSGPTASR